jgi:hypothetical protein
MIVSDLTATACSPPAGWHRPTVCPVGRPTEGQKTGGAAELREAPGDCADLLAEVAGIAAGASESKGPEYVAQGRAMADPCPMAGADEDLIPGWITEGKRRAEAARQKPGTLRPAP